MMPSRFNKLVSVIERYGLTSSVRFLWDLLLARSVVRRGRLVTVRIPELKHPISVRARTSDVSVLMHLFVGRELDAIQPADPRFIIDAGANIGLTVAVWASRYPDCRIVAIEVDSENFELLARNCAPYKNVELVRAALWHETGFVRITNPSASPWAFQVESTTAESPDAIKAVCLSDLIRDHRSDEIDLLKVDIEGSEVELFSLGTRDWIEHTRLIAVELHERFRPGGFAALEEATGVPRATWEWSGEYAVVVVDRKASF